MIALDRPRDGGQSKIVARAAGAPTDDHTARSRAIMTYCALVGAIGVARAASDEHLSREILKTLAWLLRNPAPRASGKVIGSSVELVPTNAHVVSEVLVARSRFVGSDPRAWHRIGRILGKPEVIGLDSQFSACRQTGS